MELLAKWWRDKYQLPSNHDLFQNSTVFDLLTELYEDRYYANDLEVYRNEDGEVQFIKTGDKVIDRWEKELAEGRTPDYLDTFTPEQIDTLNRMRTRGTDKFGKSVPSSSPSTIGDTMEAVSHVLSTKGTGLPPTFEHFKRFKDEE